jgi:hypothetical protein
MPEIFASDDEPRREEKEDLGGGVALSFLSNTLQAVETSSSLLSHAVKIQNKDHLDISDQQNKTARILRLAMAGGFLMVVADIIVISEVSGIATRVILGGASVVGLSLVYYLRSILMPANRDLLKERKTIRAEAAALIDKQEQGIENLRHLLTDSEHFRAIIATPQDRKVT